MGDYFKPWRRKIGVVTLVVACVFMAGWIRSFNFADAIQLDSVCFCSGEGNLYVMGPKPLKMDWEWPEWNVEKDAHVDSVLNAMKWKWRFMGFGYSEIGFFDSKIQVILAHYWSIAIPIADNLSNHQSYIAGWIATLKCDPKFIFKAASQASRAVDFILSFSRTPDEAEEPAEETVLV
jgi:hypothetical protein